MSIGLIGRKVGMTQVFQPDGTMVGVSVVVVTPNTVTRLLTEEQRVGARALGLAIRLACDLSGRAPQLLVNARARVEGDALVLTASDGYADVLLGEQTRRRGKALAEDMGLKLDLRS